MKRVRTEQIQMAVSCYLKRRQYVDTDGPLKQGLRLSQTPEEMAANLTGGCGPLRAGELERGTHGKVPSALKPMNIDVFLKYHHCPAGVAQGFEHRPTNEKVT